jgi:hypothetical protein
MNVFHPVCAAPRPPAAGETSKAKRVMTSKTDPF